MALRAFWGNYWKVADTLGLLRDKVLYKPFYYHYFSRDCDCCEREYCAEWTEGKKKYLKWCEMEFRAAEGPTSIHVIPKEEYEQWLEFTEGRTQTRDRVLEAFENGHGTSVLI